MPPDSSDLESEDQGRASGVDRDVSEMTNAQQAAWGRAYSRYATNVYRDGEGGDEVDDGAVPSTCVLYEGQPAHQQTRICASKVPSLCSGPGTVAGL